MKIPFDKGNTERHSTFYLVILIQAELFQLQLQYCLIHTLHDFIYHSHKLTGNSAFKLIIHIVHVFK